MTAIDLAPDTAPGVSASGATISPSSLGVFFALNQCQRYFRLALMSRHDRDALLTREGIVAEQIPPTLSVEGKAFELLVEDALRSSGARTRLHRADLERAEATIDQDAPDLLVQLDRLPPGQSIVIGQHRLAAQIGRWPIAGQPDVVVARRDGEGNLSLLVCDIKASREPRLEHRLQVALYGRLLGALRPDAAVEQGVIYRRPPVRPTDDAALKVFQTDEELASRRLGVDCALLSLADETDEFDEMLSRILLDDDSEAARIVERDLADLPFHLERKCDVCAYNELCLKRSRESGDLSLVPYLDAQDKTVLRLNGVETVADLAGVASGPAELRERLLGTWPVGQRLGELTVRAASYLKWQHEEIEVSEYLSERGYSTLPAVSSGQHANLIQIFIDAQLYDPDERLYMLGALVRVHRDGKLVPGRHRRVLRILPNAPRTDEDERGLLTEWIREVLEAIRDLAFPRVEHDRQLAPIHLYMFEENTKQVLLGAIQRNADAVLGVDALFKLLTQRAAYETGNISVVADEVERQWNLPMLCQSLQAVATYRGFDWDAERPLRGPFRHRHFDQLGRFETDDDQPLYAPKRSRFKSDVPIEYPFLAWSDAATVELGDNRRSAFGKYKSPTLEDLKGLGAARLEALAFLVDKLRANAQTTKSDFDLAQLLKGVGRLRDGTLLQAMKNFVVVERHVVLNAWRAAHAYRPERRVLAGDTLIGVYRNSDQEVGVRTQLRQSWEEHRKSVAAWQSKIDQGIEGTRQYPPQWSYPEVKIRLDLTAEAMGMDPAQAIRRCDLKVGSWVTIAPRETVDTREDAPSKEPFAPTPRQLMLSMKGEITRFGRDGSRHWVEVELRPGSGRAVTGFTFGASLAAMLEDDVAYTLDSNPSSPSDANRLTVIEAVEGGLPHPFAGWLERHDALTAEWPVESTAAQRRFFDGLLATGQLTTEIDKERYIAEHGADPVLLVQGPPGTGKSFTTAFAVLARVQGALAVEAPYVVAVSCATHAATDVVLRKIAETRDALAVLAARQPEVFSRHFDKRLLDVPVIRWTDGDDWEGKGIPDGCRRFSKKSESARANEVAALGHAVVGGTPGKVRKLGKAAIDGKHGPCFDLCVIDEASQMTAPDALQATVGLKPTGRVVFVGDHRQMPPIVHNDWDRDSEFTFDPYATHRSVFDLIRLDRPKTPYERFARSFRLQPEVAEYLRREIYVHDGIHFHSTRAREFDSAIRGNEMVEAILNGGHPLVVVRHDERSSQQRNVVESAIVTEIYRGLDGRQGSRRDRVLDAGVVVPHRAQRAEIREELVRALGWEELAEGVDTVERFQGGERELIIVSATESDPAYLRLAGEFLFDPRRLTVAISRARQKLIVVAAQTVFDYLPPDIETLRDTALWRNLLHPDVSELIWSGSLGEHRVDVFGSRTAAPAADILG